MALNLNNLIWAAFIFATRILFVAHPWEGVLGISEILGRFSVLAMVLPMTLVNETGTALKLEIKILGELDHLLGVSAIAAKDCEFTVLVRAPL